MLFSHLLKATFFIALTALSTCASAQFDKKAWNLQQPTPAIAWQGLKGKTVVLNFWATWCAPCKEELPSLNTLSEISDPEQVMVLAVNVKEPMARAQRYLQTSNLPLNLIADPNGEIARQWGISVFPTTILIDSNGKARWRIMGAVDWTSREAQGWIQALR